MRLIATQENRRTLNASINIVFICESKLNKLRIDRLNADNVLTLRPNIQS
jgi:hypothetical protein